jgi:hydrogenase expression/formation protein HypC
MCLAIPGQIVEILDERRSTAKVEFSGVRRNVNIELVREDGVDVGKWVLVHVGFALRVLDEDDAAETLRYLEMIGREYREELEQIGESVDPGGEASGGRPQSRGAP